jgi:hypothetical protein
MSITDRIVAIEEHLLAVERRVEDNVKAAFRERLTAVEDRLANVRARVVDELRRELRHLLLDIALGLLAVILAMIGGAFLVAWAWLMLEARYGATVAACVIGVALLAASSIPAGMLRSILHRTGNVKQAK